MHRREWIIWVAVVGLVALIVASLPGLEKAIRGLTLTPVPSSAINVPVYPNAQSVNFEESTPDRRVVTFKTLDAIPDVCTWYQRVLAREHWSLPSCEPSEDNVTTSSEWAQADLNGPTKLGYRFTVSANAAPDAKNHVRVEVIRFVPK